MRKRSNRLKEAKGRWLNYYGWHHIANHILKGWKNLLIEIIHHISDIITL